MRSKDRIAVGWCDPGEVDGAFAADMMMLSAARRDRLAEIIRVKASGTLARTRNTIVTQFLDGTDAAWLWMIDTDHRVPVAAFDALVDSAHDAAAPVIAGLCFAAWPSDGPYPRPIPCAYDYTDGSFTPIRSIEPRALHKVDGVGTGSLLVHRDVLQKIRDAAPDGYTDWCWFADGPIGDGRWLSEDLTFCTRLTDHGVPIHVHTAAVFPHHKQHWESDITYNLWRQA